MRRNHRQTKFQEGCWATVFTAPLVAGKDHNGSFIRKHLIQWEPWDGARHQKHLDLHWGAVPLEMAFGVYSFICSLPPANFIPHSFNVPGRGCHLQNKVFFLYFFQVGNHRDICNERRQQNCQPHTRGSCLLLHLSLITFNAPATGQ